MNNENKSIGVYENWSGETPILVGTLYAEVIRGEEHFSFEYDRVFLDSGSRRAVLDPDLDFYIGRQYLHKKTNFGIFSDSAPDRWGRLLIKRREELNARREGRKPKSLTESDFLLGVYDETRMGALRFSLDDGKTFLSDDKTAAAPPWVTLRTLEEAAREFEKNEDPLNAKWLDQLIKPGSSLGGARPKATVQDIDGSLWIAKFPSKHDENDTGAWEKVTHELARLCGLDVPPSKLEVFSPYGSTFLVKRFDRDCKRRIHFSSAMTMLGKTDGASAADGTGYLQIAEFIRSNGSDPKRDLAELWRRIVFNMAVSNTDDHLRNHGFLLTDNGWRLSPLYDVNPVPSGDTLSLNVSEESNFIDIDLALETASYYGVSALCAENTAAMICSTVNRNWERLAKQYGISRGNIELMRPAFTASKT